MRLRLLQFVLMTAGMLATPYLAPAAILTLTPSQDASVFQNNTSNSLGGGQALYVGTNSNTSPRRALVEFNVASSIPAGSTITGAQLSLTLGSFAGTSGTALMKIDLHRLTANWGEGTVGTGTGFSGVGQGFAANPGDATWSSQFFGTQLWTNAGGDFDPIVSASQSVGSATLNVPFTWGSTAQLVADVQGWLDNPSSNHGWILQGPESAAQTGRLFYSREATKPEFAPTLTVTYTLVPEPSAAVLLGVGIAAWCVCRTRGKVRISET